MAEQEQEQVVSRRRRGPYPPELRARAVRMVLEHQDEYPSQWKAVESIAPKLDVGTEALRLWVKQAQVDTGARPGVSSDEKARIRQLERENRELRRANEILKAAATFFGAELDRQSRP